MHAKRKRGMPCGMAYYACVVGSLQRHALYRCLLSLGSSCFILSEIAMILAANNLSHMAGYGIILRLHEIKPIYYT